MTAIRTKSWQVSQLAVKTPADQTELKAAITKALEKIVERA